MFSEKDLRELVDHQAQSKMLSIYLNTDPAEGNADSYRLRLRSMLKNSDLSLDAERIAQYFDTEYDWSGKSVAIFSEQAVNFFRVFPLAISTADMINEGIRPNVRPLTSLLDSFGGYGVILVDKQGARLFHFHLGELQEQEGVLGQDVKQFKAGSTSMGQRGVRGTQPHSVNETVERNMRAAVEFASKFFEQKHIRRILLSGSEDNIAQFRSYMPKSWQSLVVGTFPMAMTATSHEVALRAMEVGERAEVEREELLVERLVTQAAKQGLALIGLEPVLAAVSAARVQMLIIQNDLHVSGFRCPDCQMITSEPEFACQGCQQPPQAVQDVIALAIAITIEHGGEVEVVHQNSSFEKVGKIGAFLRY